MTSSETFYLLMNELYFRAKEIKMETKKDSAAEFMKQVTVITSEGQARIVAEWTVEKAKELLPDIQVKVGEKLYLAKVGGRKNPFAGVQLYDEDKNRPGGPIEYSWEAIVRSLNTGKPLRA